MRIFKTKWFTKFAKKQAISDATLLQVVQDIEAGKIDADLGDGVIKQRIARSGQGKSAGYRSIILYQKANKAFFVYGFAKNEQANIAEHEERAFKDLAIKFFTYSDDELAQAVADETFKEINSDEQEQNI
ncbi:MAG: hypothetical protein FD167_620 [bacterium]|nr:MAG: hypothetical protein FD167_620 [bacterium]